MKAAIGCLIGLVLVVSVSAEPQLEGRVRLESGEPVADAQVRLFDLTDLQQGAVARAQTDGTGYFALPLAALGGRALPERFALGPNYPNPFNPSTSIPYQLTASAAVRLEVFNLLGQHIATLVDGERAAGFHTATWHAVDRAGRAVGAGVYIYRMTVGVESQTGRMVLIDGQAGLAAGGMASVMLGVAGGGLDGAASEVYGLLVSGAGLAPYVDSAFRVEAGMAPVELVVSSGPWGKAADDDCAFCDLFDALNDDDEGPSPSGKAQAVLAAPPAPTNLRFDAPTDSSCTVRWDAAAGATDYDVNYKPAVGGEWTNEPHRGAGLYNTINDLEPDTEYRWAVRAENGDGSSAWVFGPNFTTLVDETDETTEAEVADGQAPAAPTNLRFEAVTDSSCTVRWAAAAGATDYDVNYKPAVGGRWTNEPHRGTGLYNTINDLEPRTEYRWAVRAENGDGRSAWVFGPNFTTLADETTEEEETDSTSSEGGPDLIVQSPSVSAVTLTPGQEFTLQVTVHNQGDEQAAATTLHYYRSNNATITSSDTEVGTGEIGALDASATRAASISLTVPSTPGTYYYGACVERKSGERAGNNCSTGIRVIVENGVPSNGGSVTSITGLTGKTTLTAHPNPGYDFQRWTKGGETLSTDITYVAEATDAQETLAHFAVNQDRGKWNVGQTYSWYRFPEGEYESLEWTFMFVADPPESLSEEGLLHYYAYNFGLVNSTADVGRGYAGFQSNGLFRGRAQGKVINFSIWGSNDGKTDGLLEPNNTESGGYQIMYPFKWIEGLAYRFELREGPSGLDVRGKWWGLWVEDVATGSVTFVGEQRVPTKINGRDAKMWSSRTHVFGEDLHWWRASRGEYICSDFQPSSMAVLDVTAGANRAWPQVSYNVNSGEGRTWPNGHKTTNCHVTMFVNEQGDAQHNLGFWPESPPNVVD